MRESSIEVSECFLSNPQRVVIDTQTVLDWQFFGNPLCRDWHLPGAADGWRWLATAAMRDELAHVLARGFGSRWPAPTAPVLAFFDQHASLEPERVPSPAAIRGLRCTDTDDQKFIDLAVVASAHTLVSRDKALLRLKKAALSRHGLVIVAPANWRPPCAVAA